MSSNSLKEIQTRLNQLGYSAGRADGLMGPTTKAAIEDFQRRNDLFVDGIMGPKTTNALWSPVARRVENAVQAVSSPKSVPASWMPDAQIDRIIVHWTAGNSVASALDRQHYHILLNGDGSLVRGAPSIDKNNRGSVKPGYAAHTLNANSGSIGVSLCGMLGAVESPFNAGKSPITRAQWDVLPIVIADLCRRYGIKIGPKTVLTHAEVQSNLGITQRGKWDIARLPFDLAKVGAAAVGNDMRSKALAAM